MITTTYNIYLSFFYLFYVFIYFLYIFFFIIIVNHLEPVKNNVQTNVTTSNVSKDNSNEKDTNSKNLSAKQIKREKKTKSNEKIKRVSESEFVSDTLQTNEADLDEVKEGMKKLGIDSLAKQALETNKNGKIFTKDTNEYLY